MSPPTPPSSACPPSLALLEHRVEALVQNETLSLKRHIVVNYASQLYVAGVGILVTPLYLRVMGLEAWGLVGFFATLQVWFLLLDAGIGPSIAREIARRLGGAPDALPLRQLLRGAERLFTVMAIAGCIVIAALARPIALHWLSAQTIPAAEVASAIRVMGAIAGLRLLASLYRAGVTGFERLSWLGTFNAGSATAKAFLALPALGWWGGTPRVYFAVQLGVAVAETVVLRWQLARLVGAEARADTRGGRLSLRRLVQFSTGVAVTSALNVALNQSDRLVLSGLLPLKQFSYFSLATLAASVISLVSGPLGAVFTPRLARVAGAAEPADTSSLIHTYRLALQLMAVAVFPAASTLAFHAESLLWSWTGNHEIATAAAPILSLYATGNALAALAMLPYLLQFALGCLRWHVAGSLIFILMFIPGQIALARHFGAVGAGSFWIAVNALYLTLWLPWVHRKLLPSVRWQPLVADVARVAGSSALAAAAFVWLQPIRFEGRVASVAAITIAYLASLAAAIACLPDWRRRVWSRLGAMRHA